MSELDEIFFRYESILDYSITPADDSIDIKIFLLHECPDLPEEIKREMQKRLNVRINLKTERKENIILSANTMIKRVL